MSNQHALVIFETGTHFVPRWAWTMTILFVLLCRTRMTGTCHCDQPLIKMGCLKLFPKIGL
jgi:hypothetical protein